eukprot:CAMPEP_0172079806 /NCGR_PEP_ID=MMETSP1043-20130122/18377_1 /TAXON_ID=464988 /ORGANISM="Hemiselmis andersenii, Strain CCMP441" /LENGTH=47 /DNA_ID= /DNA_START= /DNA_END= /DNA_ORIENTATION=
MVLASTARAPATTAGWAKTARSPSRAPATAAETGFASLGTARVIQAS